MCADESDAAFIDRVAETLYRLPRVEGVALGGSRAQGVNRPDSDWDVAVYYRDHFDPQRIRELGWSGQITEIGGWGRIFNGGGAKRLLDRAGLRGVDGIIGELGTEPVELLSAVARTDELLTSVAHREGL